MKKTRLQFMYKYLWIVCLGIILSIGAILLEIARLYALLSARHTHFSGIDVALIAIGIVIGLIAFFVWLISIVISVHTDLEPPLSSQTIPEQGSQTIYTDSTEPVRPEPSFVESINSQLEEATTPPLITSGVFAGSNISQEHMSTISNQSISLEQARLSFADELRVFAMPKEGTLDLSQDKCAANVKRCRYAVADGVGASFLPSKWAEIVVDSFVELPEDLTTPQKFSAWLSECCNKWMRWVDKEWIPDVKQRLGTTSDWNKERARGAEATFIGCSYSPIALEQTGHTNILVTAVGDAVFFLIRPSAQWLCKTFALEYPEQFGPIPETLATASQDPRRAWRQVKQEIYEAQPGDYVLLATDALAKWILTLTKQGGNPWIELLTLTNDAAFREFVVRERDRETLDVDDTTLMTIPIK